MRPAGRAELDSLYFDYPEYEWERPCELDGKTPLHPVVIAGAGPVGLTAAVALARRGIASVLLEKKNTLNDGSRAICVSRYSYETLQQLGLHEPFVAKGLGWTHGQCYYRGETVHRFEMPHSEQERFLPMYNIQQQYIEQFLMDKASEYPDLIDLRWQSEVTGLQSSDQGVELNVRCPGGEYSLRAQYLLAADGGKSPTRKMLDLRLNGENLPGNYVIADIRMEHDFPTERRSFFESAANPNATILVHKEPDNIWRIDWQILDSEDPDAAIEEGTIRQRVQAILAMIGHDGPWELEWWSMYTANTLCLDDYRHGRVLFIGDAAHIVPIFGVRGLNNGFADAVNVAWKLAYVLDGGADEKLLDSYTQERRGATLDVFLNAGKSSRFMTPPSRGYALMRKAVLELSLSEEFTRPFADPRQVLPYTYKESPLTIEHAQEQAFAGGCPAGSAAINRRLSTGDFLLDHLGSGFTGLYFTTQDAVPDAVLDLFSELGASDTHFKPVVVSRNELPQGGYEFLLDAQNSIFSGYAAQDDTFYLLRPDRHIAARWCTTESRQVTRALRIALGEIK
tara:strand:- start:36915 stop:38612 length:1698 start_codon:yes stop_codon:yes gene_type:complete